MDMNKLKLINQSNRNSKREFILGFQKCTLYKLYNSISGLIRTNSVLSGLIQSSSMSVSHMQSVLP